MNRPSELRAPNAEARNQKIKLRLGDVLSRIPARFLKPGPHDPGRELVFSIQDLSEDIARGRASVSLTQIARLCPEIFRGELDLADEIQVQLPLQKLFAQLGNLTPPPRISKTVATEEKPADEGEKISLNLAAIFRLLPASVIGGAAMPDEQARVELPLALIEPQLATGHVEIALEKFLAALPENIRGTLRSDADCNVWIPLDEIFQNLPARHPFHFGDLAAEVSEPEPVSNPVEMPASAASARKNGHEPARGEFVVAFEAGQRPQMESVAPPSEGEHPRPLFFMPEQDAANAAPVAAEADSAEQRLADSTAQLPGIFACVVVTNQCVATAGDFPPGRDLAVLQKQLLALHDAARAFAEPLGWSHQITLPCRKFSVSIFAREHEFICALHHERTLPSPVREILAS